MLMREIHYDFKFKLNKIDSNQYQNFRVPEIDHVANLAYLLFVKKIAMPRIEGAVGFEVNQRNIDSIRPLVVEGKSLDILSLDDRGTTFALPTDYMFNISNVAMISKAGCPSVRTRKVFNVQHDDIHESDPFANSSFEWRELNISFNESGLKAYHPLNMAVDSMSMDYIKKLEFIHNAEQHRGGTYKANNGEVLTGTREIPLAHHTHPEIVNIMVQIVSGIIEKPNGGFYEKKIAFDAT